MKSLFFSAPLAAWSSIAIVYSIGLINWSRSEYVTRIRNYYFFSHFLIATQITLGTLGVGRIELPATLSDAVSVLGVLCCVAGVTICISARYSLGQFWDMHASIQKQHQLICNGLYQFSRNPLFIGQVFLFVGTGLSWCNLPVALCALPAVVSFKRRIANEEKQLEYYFGSEYRRYCKHVARYLRWPLEIPNQVLHIKPKVD